MSLTKYDAKNARAITQFKSWLTALDIPHRTTVGGSDLILIGKDGTEVEVQIRAEDSPPASRTAIVFQAGQVTGRSISKALDLFQSVVELLGYEYRSPVSRGALPTKNAHFATDFEGVAFRHTELHRVPNPSAAELAKYDRVVRQEVYGFLRRYSQICQDEMLTADDLTTYAQVWICNYIGLHAVSEDRGTENLKKAVAYLQQRFAEFQKLLWKRGRNVFAHLDEASIATTGETFKSEGGMSTRRLEGEGNKRGSERATGYFQTRSPYDLPDTSIDEAFVARRCELDVSNPTARRSSADKKLSESLSALPHDRMIEVLTEVSGNNRLDPTARREAASRLRQHAASCVSCKQLSVPAEEDEETTGVDALSAAE